jgi:hypothetical protein
VCRLRFGVSAARASLMLVERHVVACVAWRTSEAAAQAEGASPAGLRPLLNATAALVAQARAVAHVAREQLAADRRVCAVWCAWMCG